MNEVSEQIEKNEPKPERPMSPEGRLVFDLINGINRAYVAGLSQGLGAVRK